MNDCFAEPEQSLRSGDIIVAIERRLLVDLSEDEVEENFGAEFVDGASLVVGTFEELQHFSLQSISRRASDIVNMSAAPSEVAQFKVNAGNLVLNSIKAYQSNGPWSSFVSYSQANQVLNCFQTGQLRLRSHQKLHSRRSRSTPGKCKPSSGVRGTRNI